MVFQAFCFDGAKFYIKILDMHGLDIYYQSLSFQSKITFLFRELFQVFVFISKADFFPFLMTPQWRLQ